MSKADQQRPDETQPNPNSNVVDRRLGLDRRSQAGAHADYKGLERRRGPGIRREEDRRSAEEGEMTDEQFEFLQAIESYKRLNKRLFPTWTEVLEVVTELGYRKVARRSIKLDDVPEPTLWTQDSEKAA
ncbi:MAG: hypothetical protein ACFCVE_08330 [Phycisphaerae bacterium]